MKIAKYDYCPHGSSTFETAKGSQIDEKSLQNYVEHQVESNLGPILEVTESGMPIGVAVSEFYSNQFNVLN